MIEVFYVLGNSKDKKKKRSTSSASSSTSYSARSLNMIMEKLKCANRKESTKKTYLAIWRNFNNFIIKLDVKPQYWEERTAMFLAHLAEGGAQSSTLKSYVSAIKRILTDDGYVWNDNIVLLSSLTKGCKLINDKVRLRLPIQCGLLEVLLFEVCRYYSNINQPFHIKLFQAMFALGYCGLFRVGELTYSQHVIKAKNVMGQNKEKMLIILLTSKTHGKESYPQKVRIVSNLSGKTLGHRNRFFCPFRVVNDYIQARGYGFLEDEEQFFIYREGSPVLPSHARQTLRNMLKNL